MPYVIRENNIIAGFAENPHDDITEYKQEDDLELQEYLKKVNHDEIIVTNGENK